MVIAILVLLVLPLLAIVGSAVIGRTPVDPRRVAWLAGGVPDQSAEPVYRAYLQRHRRARLLGCLAGVFVAALAAWRWTGGLLLQVGIGSGPIGGDLLVGALGGMTLGTLAAETYRIRPARSDVRQALLETRPPRPEPVPTWISRGLAAAAVALAVVAAWLGELGPLAGAALAVGVGALAEITQRAITDRRRPADADAAAVDARLRSFAGTSVAWLQFAGACLGFGWALSGVAPAPSFGPIQLVVVLATLAAAIVALLRSAVRPPRGWTPGSVV